MKRKILLLWLALTVVLAASILILLRERQAEQVRESSAYSLAEPHVMPAPPTNPPMRILPAASTGSRTSLNGGATNSALPEASASTQLTGSRRRPDSKLASQFQAGNETDLLKTFRGTTNLTERTALIWVLSRVGGEETAKAFIHTLTEEFKGRTLSAEEAGSGGNEETVMQTIAFCMGFLGSRSKIASDFLVQAKDPSFWEKNIGWTSSTGKEVYGLLASSAIQAIGIMDRQDVADLLQKMKAHPPQDIPLPQNLRRTFEGGVMDAAFYHDMVQERGADGFYRWFLDRSDDVVDPDGSYRRWMATTNGLEWKKWYEQRTAEESK